MKLLIANLGSTSFKYRLYQLESSEGSPALLAKDGYERLENHGEAIDDALEKLVENKHLSSPHELDGIGFKTVMGKNLSGCLEADEQVLEALEGFAQAAPAHNPPYANAIRLFREKLPKVPRVALFETAFYQWMPEAAHHYAIPRQWYDAGVRRYGYHGASHKHIAERSAHLLGREDVAQTAANLYQHGARDCSPPCRVISCHLGGSSSVCGILNGRAIGASMGFTPQSGLPQNNRVGDLDSGAIPYMMQSEGLSLETVQQQLNQESGLYGLSGVSNDVRDIRDAAENGNQRAQLALDVFVHAIRQWIGAFAFQMGGCDALVFTGGIGENHSWLRRAVCENLETFGISLDETKNDVAADQEIELQAPASSTRIYVIPANEEAVIAREVFRYLKQTNA